MSQQNTQERLQQALDLHRAGRLAEAETLYREILQQYPNNPDALQLLGFLIHQARRDPKAAELLKRAIAISPGAGAYHNQLGVVLLEQGKPADAASAFAVALRANPAFAAAHNNLGNALQAQNQHESAIAAYRQAIGLEPGNAEYHFNLGTALKSNNQLPSAADAFRAAIKLQPQFSRAHNNLGYALFLVGSLEDAIQCFREAIRISPDYAEAYNNLGNALNEQHKWEQGHIEIQTALRLSPDYPDAHYNLALGLRAMMKTSQAISHFRRAIELKPDFAEAHWDLAHALLMEGNFEEAWREFEWRLKWKEFPAARRAFAKPRWQGEELSGKTVLIHAEQGLGDTVQFARFVPLVAERGGRTVIECQPALKRILRRLPGVAQVISSGDTVPHFDLHCPLLSLAFATASRSIPAGPSYLTPDPLDVQAWRARLGGEKSRLKVGIVWAGSGQIWKGRESGMAEEDRSIGLSRLAPLARADCRFFSLQKGPGAAEAKSPPAGLELIDYTDQFHDFAETAALMANLDLIISVDTSVAHVAGALGLPTWVMLPLDADWRWSSKTDFSAWYPTIRMFRQSRQGDWQDMVDSIATALAERRI